MNSNNYPQYLTKVYLSNLVIKLHLLARNPLGMNQSNIRKYELLKYKMNPKGKQ